MFKLMDDTQFNKQVAAEMPDALYEKALRLKTQGEMQQYFAYLTKAANSGWTQALLDLAQEKIKDPASIEEAVKLVNQAYRQLPNVSAYRQEAFKQADLAKAYYMLQELCESLHAKVSNKKVSHRLMFQAHECLLKALVNKSHEADSKCYRLIGRSQSNPPTQSKMLAVIVAGFFYFKKDQTNRQRLCDVLANNDTYIKISWSSDNNYSRYSTTIQLSSLSTDDQVIHILKSSIGYYDLYEIYKTVTLFYKQAAIDEKDYLSFLDLLLETQKTSTQSHILCDQLQDNIAWRQGSILLHKQSQVEAAIAKLQLITPFSKHASEAQWESINLFQERQAT